MHLTLATSTTLVPTTTSGQPGLQPRSTATHANDTNNGLITTKYRLTWQVEASANRYIDVLTSFPMILMQVCLIVM